MGRSLLLSLRRVPWKLRIDREAKRSYSAVMRSHDLADLRDFVTAPAPTKTDWAALWRRFTNWFLDVEEIEACRKSGICGCGQPTMIDDHECLDCYTFKP